MTQTQTGEALASYARAFGEFSLATPGTDRWRELQKKVEDLWQGLSLDEKAQAHSLTAKTKSKISTRRSEAS